MQLSLVNAILIQMESIKDAQHSCLNYTLCHNQLCFQCLHRIYYVNVNCQSPMTQLLRYVVLIWKNCNVDISHAIIGKIRFTNYLNTLLTILLGIRRIKL